MIKKILYLMVTELTISALAYFSVLLLTFALGLMKFETIAYMIIGTLTFIFIMDVTVRLYDAVKNSEYVKGD